MKDLDHVAVALRHFLAVCAGDFCTLVEHARFRQDEDVRVVRRVKPLGDVACHLDVLNLIDPEVLDGMGPVVILGLGWIGFLSPRRR